MTSEQLQARRKADRDYARYRNRLIAYGRWKPWVNTDPVRRHVLDLNARGVTVQRIAVLAGVSGSVLSRLLYGEPARAVPPQTRMRSEIADKILAVRAHPLEVGARRRLQALVAIGWSLRRLAPMVGLAAEPLTLIASGRRSTVQPATAEAISRVYDQLWHVQPPATTKEDRISVTKTRSFAASRGWVSPLAWDDDTIDDPEATPNTTGRGR